MKSYEDVIGCESNLGAICGLPSIKINKRKYSIFKIQIRTCEKSNMKGEFLKDNTYLKMIFKMFT